MKNCTSISIECPKVTTKVLKFILVMSSPASSRALAIAPKFTAFLSICGSLGIVVKVLCNPDRRKKTMHRLVMGMSMCDLLSSIWYFTGTWAIPSGTPSWFGDDEAETMFWAAGDSDGVSCSFAGFFNQFAVATPLYNTTLSVYYLQVIKFGWRDNRVAKIEWLLHAIPVGYALMTSIFAVAAELYGHVEWTCWILPSEVFDETAELTPIQSKFQIIQWIFLFGIVWACIVVVTIIFVIIYRKMKSLERIMRRYPYSSTYTAVSRAPSGNFSSRVSNSNGEFSMESIRELSVKSINMSGPLRVQKETECTHIPDIEKRFGEMSDFESHDKGEHDSASIVDEEADRHDNPNDEDNEEIESGTESDTDGVRRKTAKNSNCVSVIEKSNEPKQSSHIEDEEKEIINSETISVEASVRISQENRVTERSTKTLIFTGRQRLKGRNRKSDQNNRETRIEVAKSMKIAVQGLLYVGAFYITWTFPTVSRLTELIAKKNYFSIQFLDTLLLPLQGFLNFIIYVRPRFLNYRFRHQDEGFWKALKVVVFEIKIS